MVFWRGGVGRGVDIPGVLDANANANAVEGPCWQYVLTRGRFGVAAAGSGAGIISMELGLLTAR